MTERQWVMLLTGIGMAGIFLLLPERTLTEAKAVPCIIGEAEGEPYAGKVFLAHALINRNTTVGVYGCRAERAIKEKYSRATLIDATLAWNEARRSHDRFDPVSGAKHWLSTDGNWSKISWVNNCAPTVKIGKHVFFKCP